MPAPKVFNPDVHIDWGWALAAKGKTDIEIAEEFGVTERTINRWKFVTDESGNPVLDGEGNKILSDFGKALETAKEVADAKVKRSLYQKCIGYDSVDEEKIIEYDLDGNVKPVKVRTIKKHVPPDTMAIMYWLNNRSRKTGEWSQKQEITLDGAVDIREQDRKVREALDKLTDEQLDQYESLCKTVNGTT